MKKGILFVIAVASLAYTANSESYMRVKNYNGSVDYYKVDNVSEIDFVEDSRSVEFSESGKFGLYSFVDLGLRSGLLWATVNVGADNYFEYGDYFAWGETKTKDVYSWDTYKWSVDGGSKMTKYTLEDGKTVLEADDDAVTANWGEDWRMPTNEEMKELFDGCTWTWTEDLNGTGVSGYIGKSKSNETSIFLPAAGYRYNSNVNPVHGIYWTATPDLDYTDASFVAEFYEDEDVRFGNYSRYYGHCVRGVANQTYTVRFMDSDSTLIEEQKVRKGESAKVVETPEKDDYIFVEWSDSSFTNVMSDLTVYAKFKEILPMSKSGLMGGKSYVDLGLKSGLKWAAYNVGSKSIVGVGDYFAWGETSPKTSYGWDTYKWRVAGESIMTKYTLEDGKTVLEAEDDAATVNMGEIWRMPTKDEMKEMFEICTWEWTENLSGTGVAGYVGTSTKTGATIFLPAAGYRYDSYVNPVHGIYWTATPDLDYKDASFVAEFYKDEDVRFGNYSRYYGHCIRAVSDK